MGRRGEGWWAFPVEGSEEYARKFSRVQTVLILSAATPDGFYKQRGVVAMKGDPKK
jgi:hypothetical protein